MEHFNELFFGSVFAALCDGICAKFETRLDQQTLKRGIDREALFLRLQKMSGIHFARPAIDKLPEKGHGQTFVPCSDVVNDFARTTVDPLWRMTSSRLSRP